MPATEEKSTKCGEVQSRGQLVQVPGGVHLGRQDAVEPLGRRATRSRRRRATPAAWTTAPSGCSAGIAASSVCQLRRGRRRRRRRSSTSAPSSSSSARSSSAPCASGPLRLTSSRWRAPCSARRGGGRQGAEAAGAAGDQDRALGVERGRLRSALGLGARPGAAPSAAPSRRASWGSSPPAASAAGSAPSEASVPSLSIRTKRPGCSDCGRADQAPERARRRGRGLSASAADRALGEQRQAASRPGLVGEPGLQRLEGLRGSRGRASAGVAGASAVGRRSAGLDLALGRARPLGHAATSLPLDADERRPARVAGGLGSSAAVEPGAAPSESDRGRRARRSAIGELQARPRRRPPARGRTRSARGAGGAAARRRSRRRAAAASCSVVRASRPSACRAASSSAGWMPKRSASLACSSGRATSAKISSPSPPGRAQALEGRAVVEAALGEALVEVVDLERLGSRGRPGGEVGVRARRRAGREGRRVACRVHSRPRSSRLGREWIATRGGRPRRARRRATWSCDARPARGGQRRLQGELLDASRSRPARPPAGPARRRRCRAGGRCRRRRGRPARGGWQGEAAGEQVRPSPAGSSTAAPSSGCSAGAEAGRAEVAGAAGARRASSAGAGRGRWAGRTRLAPCPSKKAAQSTLDAARRGPRPRASGERALARLVARAGSGSRRLRPRPRPRGISAAIAVRTGSGPSSRKAADALRPPAVATPSAKRTGSRRRADPVGGVGGQLGGVERARR